LLFGLLIQFADENRGMFDTKNGLREVGCNTIKALEIIGYDRSLGRSGFRGTVINPDTSAGQSA
jgi:hypothetical protein